MRTHLLIPIKELKTRIAKLKLEYQTSSMGEGLGIMREVDVLEDLLIQSKKLKLGKRTTQQAASNFAGDRTQGGEHGWPSWTASCILKGYNQAIKDILS